MFCDLFLRSHLEVTHPLERLFFQKEGLTAFPSHQRTWNAGQAPAPSSTHSGPQAGTLLFSCQILQPTGLLGRSACHFPCGCDDSKGLQPGRIRCLCPAPACPGPPVEAREVRPFAFKCSPWRPRGSTRGHEGQGFYPRTQCRKPLSHL